METAAKQRPRLGELLIQAGAITEQGLQSALETQERWETEFGHRRIGEVVVRLELCDGETVAAAVGRQIGLGTVAVRKSRIDLRLVAKVPKDLALKGKILPIAKQGHVIEAAVADPELFMLHDEVQRRLGARVRKLVCEERQLMTRIVDAYRALGGRHDWLEPDTSMDRLEAVSVDLPAGASGGTSGGTSGGVDLAGYIVGDDAFEIDRTGQRVEEVPAAKAAPAAAPKAAAPKPAVAEAVLEEITEIIDAEPPAAAVSAGIAGIAIVTQDQKLGELLLTAARRRHLRAVVDAGGGGIARLLGWSRPRLLICDLSMWSGPLITELQELHEAGELDEVTLVCCGSRFSDWRACQDFRQLTGADDFIVYPAEPFRVAHDLERVLIQSLVMGEPAGMVNARVAAEAAVKAALAHHEAGRFPDAIRLFREAVEYDDAGMNRYFLAEALAASGQTYLALAEYEAAVARMPKYFIGLRKLATLYKDLGFQRLAADAYERAIAVCPNPTLKKRIAEYLSTQFLASS